MYHGKHRRSEVGSLRWNDEGCLIAERMEQAIAEQIIERSDTGAGEGCGR